MQQQSVQNSGPRDYVSIAKAYAHRAADERNSGQIGRWVRLAAQRFLNDLNRAKKSDAPFYFDEWEACNPCDFIEKLPHVEGKWETDTIVLHESDIFFLVNLFGFRKHDGTRRFSIALKAVARKNAKSTIAAAIGLYCQVCEGENGPQVITGATTGAQARIVFNIAKRMVEKTKALRDHFNMQAFANAIASYDNKGTFKPINAKASTQDGLNPSCTILDEIHAHKTHDLMNVLRSAAGARTNPLFLFTTTEGYETPGPWPELRHFAKQVLEGLLEADHFLIIYYAIDDEDGDFDESTYIKANPLMTVNPILLKEIQKESIEAKAMPGRLAEFRIKRLNRPSSSAEGWINLVKWKQNIGPVDLEWLKKYPCKGGLDLASTSDLVSFRLAWFIEQRWYTYGWRFVPTAAVRGRSERGIIPYPGWVAAKYLIQAGDEVTDYDAVLACMVKAKGEFNLQEVAYDSWNATQLAAKATSLGLKMTEFIQGPKSYHPAMKELERAYTDGRLNHGNDPVLNWNASNIIARTDQNMNMAPDKKRSMEKIDDIVALLMAIGVTIANNKEPEKKFQLFFA